MWFHRGCTHSVFTELCPQECSGPSGHRSDLGSHYPQELLEGRQTLDKYTSEPQAVGSCETALALTVTVTGRGPLGAFAGQAAR